MKIEKLAIEGAWLIESKTFVDERGEFREWFKSFDFQKETGILFVPRQANVSRSMKGTLRGIHYSIAKKGQAKWVTCVHGSIRDIVVDIRPDSETYGQWIEVFLSDKSDKSILISEGLGHAFLSLENDSIVTYLLSTPYAEEYEFEINPFDSELGINWNQSLNEIKMSSKDRSAPSLHQRKSESLLPFLSR